MPARPGRPASPTFTVNRSGNVNRTVAIPVETFKRLQWLADYKQRKANVLNPEVEVIYWSVGKVIVDAAQQLLKGLESDSEVQAYFERCARINQDRPPDNPASNVLKLWS